jgi:acetolactate synthase small subunit
MSREIVISKKLKKQFDEEVNQIQILEETQGIIYRRLLAMLKIEDQTPEADAIFDLAFNRTPHVKEWIKFK